MTPPSTGKACRDLGCSLAASKRPVKTLGLQLLILERATQETPFTVDDVIDPGSIGNRSNHTGQPSWHQRNLIRFTGQIEQSERYKVDEARSVFGWLLMLPVAEQRHSDFAESWQNLPHRNRANYFPSMGVDR